MSNIANRVDIILRVNARHILLDPNKKWHISTAIFCKTTTL